MVCINSIVNVKQKQTLLECDTILDVSVRERLHFIFDAGSVVNN